MDKRFLPSSHKQESNHKISSLRQENLKVEDYIKEFKQLQMRVGLDEEPKLKISRFIKGLLPNIANKVNLRSYLSFDYVCNLSMKVKKQLKDRKFFHPC